MRKPRTALEMKHYIQGLWALTILWCMASAHAGAASDRLNAFFNNVHSLQGDFSQTVYDQHNNVKDRAQGSLAIQRPGKFRWYYEKPYHQLIVANGAKVWIYDSELEQVTVKKFDQALGSTPAQLLSSSAALEKNFTIAEIGAKDGLEWVVLTPHDKDASFEKITLGFDADNLRVMQLKDNFSQTTQLEFSHLQHNPHLAASLFEFTSPPGVDVVGDTN
jgi:outer membrane lipoprotein carrier protein